MYKQSWGKEKATYDLDLRDVKENRVPDKFRGSSGSDGERVQNGQKRKRVRAQASPAILKSGEEQEDVGKNRAGDELESTPKRPQSSPQKKGASHLKIRVPEQREG